MDEKRLRNLIDHASADLSYVIREVGKRGVSDNALEADDFGILLSRKEFKDLVVGELYEAYFLPERHEFDWQLVRELVTIITSERIQEFIALSAVTGVLGNAAFATLRSVLAKITAEMKKVKLPSKRQQPFRNMKADVDGVEAFFQRKGCARITEVESSTGIARERLRPLLKLLGFTHHRRKFVCHWCKPGTTASEDPQA